MAVNPMMYAGVTGLHNGLTGLRNAAEEIASEPVTAINQRTTATDQEPRSAISDQADALLELKLYTRQVQAAAKVVETADEVLGFLIDLHA